MKFNMGCGRRHLADYINVDSQAASNPDEVFDLEVTPWPWPTACAEEILFNHSLEHMGGDPKVFLAIMQEIYRIAAPGAVVQINVPHPRHDTFIADPTHVRPVTDMTLTLFDRRLNDEWYSMGAANTPFAHYLDVDFEITQAEITLEDVYLQRCQSGEISEAQVFEMLRTQNNIASELKFTLRVHKPGRGA
jgi:hypothetical protein